MLTPGQPVPTQEKEIGIEPRSAEGGRLTTKPVRRCQIEEGKVYCVVM